MKYLYALLLYWTSNVKLSEKTQKSSKKLYSRTSILGHIFTLSAKVDLDAHPQVYKRLNSFMLE